MQAVRRSAAARSAQSARSYTRQQQRRWAHDAHHDSHSHAAASGPSEEKLGRGFFIGIATIPAAFAFFTFSGPGNYEQKYWTRVIHSYDDWRQTWAQRTDLHTQAIEQAAADRNLFINSTSTRHVDLKFPEIINTGAPWNVPAGSRANMDHVIAKYEKDNFEQQAKKLQQLKDNNVPAEQPITRTDAGKMQLM